MDDGFLGGVALRPQQQPAQQRIGGDAAEHDRRQLDAVEQHHRQRDDDQQAVEQRLDEMRRQRLLDLLYGAEARHHVARLALLEPRQRQLQQVREDVAEPLHAERRRQVEHRPRAQRAGRHLERHQQAEADDQRDQQVAVGARQHAVDDPLQEEGRQQREGFERQRQHEDLRQRPAEPVDPAEQPAQADALSLDHRLEVGRRRQFERHPGEMPRQLGQRQPPHAARRIVDLGHAAPHRLQHDEMVQVPVQHAGQLAAAADARPRRAAAARRAAARRPCAPGRPASCP